MDHKKTRFVYLRRTVGDSTRSRISDQIKNHSTLGLSYVRFKAQKLIRRNLKNVCHIIKTHLKDIAKLRLSCYR